MEIRDSSQTSTTAPIFLLSNYFRQKYLEIASCAVSLLNDIWVRVDHSLLQQLNLQKVNCSSSSLQAGCEWNCGDELNTSLKEASNNLNYEKNHEKYLYISNSTFTMMLAPVKKVILRFFPQLDVICLCAKFEVSLTPATGFLPIDATFLANMWCKYFSFNIWTVAHQLELELSDLDQNWPKTRHLLFKTFDISNFHFYNGIAA